MTAVPDASPEAFAQQLQSAGVDPSCITASEGGLHAWLPDESMFADCVRALVEAGFDPLNDQTTGAHLEFASPGGRSVRFSLMVDGFRNGRDTRSMLLPVSRALLHFEALMEAGAHEQAETLFGVAAVAMYRTGRAGKAFASVAEYADELANANRAGVTPVPLSPPGLDLLQQLLIDEVGTEYHGRPTSFQLGRFLTGSPEVVRAALLEGRAALAEFRLREQPPAGRSVRAKAGRAAAPAQAQGPSAPGD